MDSDHDNVNMNLFLFYPETLIYYQIKKKFDITIAVIDIIYGLYVEKNLYIYIYNMVVLYSKSLPFFSKLIRISWFFNLWHSVQSNRLKADVLTLSFIESIVIIIMIYITWDMLLRIIVIIAIINIYTSMYLFYNTLLYIYCIFKTLFSVEYFCAF